MGHPAPVGLGVVKTPGRILFVHAHPDDESSQSAGTLIRYVDEGAHVTLVTCTLGELGEILVEDWVHFSPQELGLHRIQELAAALRIMGVTDHVWLGGVGHYHDSGMARDVNGDACPPDELPGGAFWAADLLEAANHLVAVIRDRRPHVVSTYDTFGGYGHPDHIQAHRVTMYACLLAGVPSHRPDSSASRGRHPACSGARTTSRGGARPWKSPDNEGSRCSPTSTPTTAPARTVVPILPRWRHSSPTVPAWRARTRRC